MRGLAIALVLLAGCSEDDKPTVDAAPGVQDAAADAPNPPLDAPVAATVVTVDCATVTPVMTVMTMENPRGFTPSAITIGVNDVVRFQPADSHNVVPNSMLPSDPGLRSGALGAVACLRFTATGMFNYQCQPHPTMKGRVTVQ
ncbi:MAG: hypothetical protein H0X17_14250 [Deltaproteobacteria bacterium]|nr:hypothetical protein [Deltaproteobacteria bacterium]